MKPISHLLQTQDLMPIRGRRQCDVGKTQKRDRLADRMQPNRGRGLIRVVAALKSDRIATLCTHIFGGTDAIVGISVKRDAKARASSAPACHPLFIGAHPTLDDTTRPQIASQTSLFSRTRKRLEFAPVIFRAEQ